MNLQTLRACARLEIRTLIKLIRTWVFLFVMLAISTAFFVLVTWHHVSFSYLNTTLGSLGPRYSAATLAIYFIALFAVGVVLSAMELPRRDQRARIDEVIGSCPVSSFELFLGRLCGVLFVFAIPMLVFLIVVVLYGWFCHLIDFPHGEPVAFWSVVSIAIWDIGPNLFFVGALVVLLSSVLRSRLGAAAVVLILILFGMWFHFRFPHFVTSPFQTITANVLFPSELAPQFLSLGIVSNRVALITLGLGFLCLTGVLSARVSATRITQFQTGFGLVFLGLLFFAGHFTASEMGKQRFQQWAVAHQEPSPLSFPDIEYLRGSLAIHPGEYIAFDFQLQVAAPASNPSDWVVFSLNPGYRLVSISLDGTVLSDGDDFKFRNGLLKISKHHFKNETASLDISARGRPNLMFAYLDTHEDFYGTVGPGTRRLYHMGTANSIFHPRFVALLAGTKWYPASGSAWREWDLEHRKRDFFNVDLEVSVPRNWIVAGPGHRDTLDANRRSVFRFAPRLPVPEISLIGSNFVRRSMVVSGDVFELLISAQHTRMLRPLLPLAQERGFHSWVSGNVKRTREETGLDYPYSLLSFVEVPSYLRSYGGGRNLDSTLSAPGIIMLRETNLPTARLKPWSDEQYMESDHPSWDLRAQRNNFLVHELLNHFAFAMQADNLAIGIHRQLFEYQTAPTGPGAIALEFMLSERVENRSYLLGSTFFSFWECVEPSHAEQFALTSYLSRKNDYSEMQQSYFSQRDNIMRSAAVWEFLESKSLTELDEIEDPRNLHGVLLTKTPQFPLSLEQTQQIDGTNTAPTLEANVLEKFRGTTFSVEDFLQIAATDHGDVKDSMRTLFNTSGLPGYKIGAPSVEVRQDEDTESSTYLTRFNLRNTEQVSGSVTVAWEVQPPPPGFSGSYTPYHFDRFSIDGNQSYTIAKQSETPFARVWVRTGVSLNRHGVLRLDFNVEPEQADVPPSDVPLISAVEWLPPTHSGIIVDDLDSGFSIVRHIDESFSSRFLRFIKHLYSRPEVEWDNGLPVMRAELNSDITTNGNWVREFGDHVFGRYRNTYAQFVPGTVSRWTETNSKNTQVRQKVASAKFSTDLPKQGLWQLAYYFPVGESVSRFLTPFGSHREFSRNRPEYYLQWIERGTIKLEIHSEDQVHLAELNSAEAQPGWNVIGVYELQPTTVDVYISNVTDGQIVIADAVRWLFEPGEEQRPD